MWTANVMFNIILSNANVINCILFQKVGIHEWKFTFLYGPPVPGMRPAFWGKLKTIGNNFDGLWNLLDDFNALLN